jgi:hypothetical protein
VRLRRDEREPLRHHPAERMAYDVNRVQSEGVDEKKSVTRHAVHAEAVETALATADPTVIGGNAAVGSRQRTDLGRPPLAGDAHALEK